MVPPPAPPTRRRQDGFVLVATIWMIVFMAAAAAILGRWIEQGLDRAFALQQRIEAEQELFSAEQQVLYLLTSNLFSARGLEVLNEDQWSDAQANRTPFDNAPRGDDYLYLDATPYRHGDVTVRVQDNRGLINLNFVSLVDLEKMLDQMGVPVEAREVLVARLQDYVDDDDLRRINGAEEADYRRDGLRPPRNGPLLSVWEARQIPGWADWPGLWDMQSGLPAFATASLSVGLNPNTAPAGALRLLPGLNDQGVEALLEARRTMTLFSPGQMSDLTGLTLGIDPLRMIFFPSTNLRITLSSPHLPRVRRISMRLLPAGLRQPWSLDTVLELPALQRDEANGIATLTPLPGSDAAAAASVPVPDEPG